MNRKLKNSICLTMIIFICLFFSSCSKNQYIDENIFIKNFNNACDEYKIIYSNGIISKDEKYIQLDFYFIKNTVQLSLKKDESGRIYECSITGNNIKDKNFVKEYTNISHAALCAYTQSNKNDTEKILKKLGIPKKDSKIKCGKFTLNFVKSSGIYWLSITNTQLNTNNNAEANRTLKEKIKEKDITRPTAGNSTTESTSSF